MNTALVKQTPSLLSSRLAYSIHEAAGALGMSASTIWKYISLGRIRSVRIGGRTLINADELQRLLNEGLL